MHSAPDVLWVFLALPIFAALGLAIAMLAVPRGDLLRPERAQLLALACTCGLLVNYALGMLISELRWVLVAGFAIAAASVAWALARHRSALVQVLGVGWLRWLLAAALLLPVAGAILFEPLQGWDARSVWFFSAKRIFFGEGLSGAKDWTLPAYGFSHADYPKLLALLAAQFAHAWGFWNEYVPKSALLLLLAPAILALLGLPRRIGLSLLFLLGVLLLSTKEFLWNGYVDTYLCLYAVISMLYFARWLAAGAPLDLALGGAFMGVAANLKNEGALLAMCLVASLVAWMVLARSTRRTLQWRSWPPGVWLALVLPWIGFAGWALTKSQWQLANDLQLGVGSLQRVWQRVGEGHVGAIAKALVLGSDAGKAAALFLFSAALARALGTRLPAAAWFPAAVALLYSAGMFVVYLATPHGVEWHLATSAERTMLLAAFGFLGSTFLVLEAMESRGPPAIGGVEQTGLQT